MEGLEQELKDLAVKLEGESKMEVKNAIDAFKAENKDAIEVAVKSAKDELEVQLKAIQEHADKLDIKMQKQAKHNISNGDEIKSLITENHKSIEGVRKGNAFEVKADMLLSTNLTGDQNREYQNTVAAIPGQAVNFEQLVRTISIGVGTFTYPREEPVTGAVSGQVEGADKSELEYSFNMIDANPEFIAGYARYSKQMANNLPYLEGFLPTALRREYYFAENALFYTTLAAAATASTVIVGNIVERIIAEMTTLMALNYVPNIIVISPQDYGSLLLTAGATGGSAGTFSLPGVVTISNGMVSVNGIQVVVASWCPADKYVIGDFSYCQKIVRQGLGIGFYDQDQDNVIKNLITARIESQATIAIQRTDSFIAGDFTTTS